MRLVKAGALQLVTYIVMLIALLLAAFIMVVHTYKKFGVDTQLQIEQIKSSQSTIHQFLEVQDISYDSIKVDNDFPEMGNTTFKRGNWGVFETYYAVSRYHNKSFASMALVGAGNSRYEKTALILKDHHMPLVVVGGTTITGDVILPKRGVKTGHIGGVSYYKEQLIYGEEQVTPRVFPQITNRVRQAIEILGNPNVGQSVIPIDQLENGSYSFLKPMVYYQTDEALVLENLSILGHVIIQSNTEITVTQTAQLNDIILIAPVINIADHVSGNFQAIATKAIQVGKEVLLMYPSALVLRSEASIRNADDLGHITIGEEADVKGVILVLGTQLPKNYQPQLTILPIASVTGMVYCEQNMELRGTVKGLVIADQFIIKEAGAVYMNHLFNAVVDRPALADEFLGIEIDDEHEKGIAKWLY
ncbi:hypothetical protein FJ651_03475 [Paucihalobacter ruber]|uniref:Uncharacterized protein n=1 Tax=Paucihalobacter ruber TaxID=2567861 RepID=A0A506PQR2_9FLAO|nr:hypothetical protein [Paucihalobacter ruber]TPV35991.1 hypothetical protein FJ651_03475 [Paucihalobacter ruber]